MQSKRKKKKASSLIESSESSSSSHSEEENNPPPYTKNRPESSMLCDDLILGEDVIVDKGLMIKLKPHQREGIKFMWNCVFESVEGIRSDSGKGCVLAHCMGLGM